MTTRILLVDDFEPWRNSVRLVLESTPSLRVIGEVSDGKQAIEKATELQPDLILCDVGMPSLNGIDAAEIIHERCPNSRIVFLTLGDFKDATTRLGAGGYVCKANAGVELLDAITTALNRQTAVPSTKPR